MAGALHHTTRGSRNQGIRAAATNGITQASMTSTTRILSAVQLTSALRSSAEVGLEGEDAQHAVDGEQRGVQRPRALLPRRRLLKLRLRELHVLAGEVAPREPQHGLAALRVVCCAPQQVACTARAPPSAPSAALLWRIVKKCCVILQITNPRCLGPSPPGQTREVHARFCGTGAQRDMARVHGR